jgi:hypothetical protein
MIDVDSIEFEGRRARLYTEERKGTAQGGREAYELKMKLFGVLLSRTRDY